MIKGEEDISDAETVSFRKRRKLGFTVGEDMGVWEDISTQIGEGVPRRFPEVELMS